IKPTATELGRQGPPTLRSHDCSSCFYPRFLAASWAQVVTKTSRRHLLPHTRRGRQPPLPPATLASRGGSSLAISARRSITCSPHSRSQCASSVSRLYLAWWSFRSKITQTRQR